MGFKLSDHIPSTLIAALPGKVECPTGKVGFATRAEADARLRAMPPQGRTTMKAFRCGYCEEFHLGHRRGTIV